MTKSNDSPNRSLNRTVTLDVNGRRYTRAVSTRKTLADFIREDLGLTGTHLGCEHGVCGACTVSLDDTIVRSCLMFAVQCDGRAVTTIEGVGADQLNVVQRAFWDHHGLQCGFCTPGMVLTVMDVLKRNPTPSEADLREELSANLCRCTGYQFIIDAALSAARELENAK